jgi:signal transduction histidine kinase
MVRRLREHLTWQMGVAVATVIVLIGAIFAALLGAVADQRSAGRDATRAGMLVSLAGQLEGRVVGMQTGVRGYLLTDDPEFLEPYRRARATYPGIADRLDQAAPTVEVGRELESIRRGIDSYLEDYQRPLLALARRDREAAIERTAGGEGRRRVEALQAQFRTLTAALEAFTAERASEADERADRAVALAAGGGVLSLALLVGFAIYLRREITQPVRRIGAAAERIAAGELSTRVAETEAANELGQAERAFNSMAAELERAREAAERADGLKDEFVALVSHELRTPLTSIVGYIELLEEDAGSGGDLFGPEERQRMCEVVNRNARRMLRLVDDLLFVARLEGGRLELASDDLDLAAVARESIEAAQPRASQGRVELVAEIVPVPPMRGDRGRIGQAIDNLVSNALKFTPEGGAVRVGVSTAGEAAWVEVEDTGIGISEADQEHMFERFFRASNAQSRQTPGIGLGLVITRAIVEGHGGELKFRSVEGEGTRFSIVLPLARADERYG